MFFALLDNVRSAYNVGSIFRTSDCAGIDGIIITGYTAYPPHPKVEKTSLGAEDSVPWIYYRDPLQALVGLKTSTPPPDAVSSNWRFSPTQLAGCTLVACELTPQADNLYTQPLTSDMILIFGHEVDGVQPGLLELADTHLRIPMFGHKDSLNVASSYAIVAYEYVRQRHFAKP